MVTVYGSATCQPCRSTKRTLDAMGVAYDYVDVTTSDEGLAKITELGYTGIPVVVTDTESWQGFDFDKLNTIS